MCIICFECFYGAFIIKCEKIIMQSVQLHDNALLVSSPTPASSLRTFLQGNTILKSNEYYLISNGKLLNNDSIVDNCIVHVVPRVLGGKGGFGSMLRAIGAQIEKTTNREACRDLSGRRLRDINEEKRLKNWINQQVEREKETTERRKKKLEKLCEPPKHEFKDEEYQKERSVLPEIVEDAVTQGLQASCSGTKRKVEDKKELGKKKKARLWIDLMDDELSSSDESENNARVIDEEDNEASSRSSEDNKRGNIENVNEECVASDTGKGNEEEVNVDDEKGESFSSSVVCGTSKD